MESLHLWAGLAPNWSATARPTTRRSAYGVTVAAGVPGHRSWFC